MTGATTPLSASRIVVPSSPSSTKLLMDESLLPFFRPNGVAVVGASASVHKLGHGIARNLAASGYPGAIHFVSQSPGQVLGHEVYGSLLQVPDPIDLAVLALPAKATPAAIRDCAARGIHAAIIISSGFRETGDEGAALERECAGLARANRIRLLGPNCIGMINTHLPLDTSFLQPPMPPPGGIAFVSHSGAFCAAIVDWSRAQGFGFSELISLGNQADVNEADMLSALADEDHTRVIALYMEGVSDGARFVQSAREAARRKPVVAIKVGRSEGGRKAAASHTAALAGSDAAFDAAFDKCGILRAATAEQLFDWARALEQCPLPAGRHVAVLTDAGGLGVIAADALELNGLELAQLRPATQGRLASRLPSAASVLNPVDMLASASPEDYASCLRDLLGDPNADAALVILPPPPTYSAESVADALIPIVRASSKPVAIALVGSQLTRVAFQAFADARIPTFPFPERAASALSALFRRAEYLKIPPTDVAMRPFPVPAPLSPSATDLVAAYGIPALGLRLATSPAQAGAIAQEIGFPVVMKIASAQITHKSDVGGVILDVPDSESAIIGYTQLVKRARSSRPDAVLDGVHIQPQVSDGQEVIVGAVRDPDFGPLIMFGAGGVEAEARHDVAFALAPLDASEAEGLIERTLAGRLLKGNRGLPPADKAAALDALVRLSWLAHDHPEISQIEVNPLRVLSHGAIALDVRFST